MAELYQKEVDLIAHAQLVGFLNLCTASAVPAAPQIYGDWDAIVVDDIIDTWHTRLNAVIETEIIFAKQNARVGRTYPALANGVTALQLRNIKMHGKQRLPFKRCGTELCNPTGHGSREHCHDCGKQ